MPSKEKIINKTGGANNIKIQSIKHKTLGNKKIKEKTKDTKNTTSNQTNQSGHGWDFLETFVGFVCD